MLVHTPMSKTKQNTHFDSHNAEQDHKITHLDMQVSSLLDVFGEVAGQLSPRSALEEALAGMALQIEELTTDSEYQQLQVATLTEAVAKASVPDAQPGIMDCVSPSPLHTGACGAPHLLKVRGATVARRATSCGVAMRGEHCIRHRPSTQATPAVSTGKAKLGGIAKGLSNALGLRAIDEDLGMSFTLNTRTDGTAAMGRCRRLGVREICHLDTPLLGVQGHVRSGEVELKKVPGVNNAADAMTTSFLARRAWTSF